MEPICAAASNYWAAELQNTLNQIVNSPYQKDNKDLRAGGGYVLCCCERGWFEMTTNTNSNKIITAEQNREEVVLTGNNVLKVNVHKNKKKCMKVGLLDQRLGGLSSF